MSQWTKEPWGKKKHHEGIYGADGTLINGASCDCALNLDTSEANEARIVACVNGCTGLNPAAFRECVEALKAVEQGIEVASKLPGWSFPIAQALIPMRDKCFLALANATKNNP